MNLPSDIWKIIGEDYMEDIDILHLSSTCRYIRSCLISLVFRKISFSGSTEHSIQSLGHHFAYLFSIQSRIQALREEPSLASCIRHVAIRNWVDIPTFLASYNAYTSMPRKHQAPAISQHTSFLLAYKLISIWLETYSALLGLLTVLPNVKKITFSEYIKRNAWQTQQYHYFESSLYGEASDCTKLYSMVEFTVPDTLSKLEVLIPSSFNISQEEHIVRLPTTTSYLLDILTSCASLQLTEAKFDGEMLYASYPSILLRLSSLKKLGLSNVPYWYTHIIEELVNLCTELVQLEVLGHDELQFSIPITKLPNLRSLTGSMSFLHRVIEHGRIIEEISIRDNDAYRISNALSHNPMLASHLHSLDVSTIRPTALELLGYFGKAWPNVKYLCISYLPTTLASGSTQSVLSTLLQGVSPFHKLEALCVKNGEILSASSPHASNIQVSNSEDCLSLREIQVTDRGIYSYHFVSGWCYQQITPRNKKQYVTATPGFWQFLEELSDTIPSKGLRTFWLSSFDAALQVFGDEKGQQESSEILYQRSSRVGIYFSKIWLRIRNKFKG